MDRENLLDKGTVVFVACAFRQGGFPNERVFILRSATGGDLVGVADSSYCYRADGGPLGMEPAEGEEVVGLLLGLVVRTPQGDMVRVELPDSDVYALSRGLVRPARKADASHVFV